MSKARIETEVAAKEILAGEVEASRRHSTFINQQYQRSRQRSYNQRKVRESNIYLNLRRNMVISMSHPQTPSGLPMIGSPINLSETPVSYSLPPPLLGEHTHEVMRDYLGYTEQQILDLQNEGVVKVA